MRCSTTYKNVNKHIEGLCYVYWIHLPEHIDITTEGYVGATKSNVKDRWVAHNSWAKQPLVQGNERLHEALNSDNELIYEVVYTSYNYEECLELEAQYRPDRYIGWNKARGGGQLDGWFSGELAKIKAVQRWQSDPETANKWWEAELALLQKQEAQRKADAYLPHGNERKLSANNSSGHTGCSFYEPFQKWRVQICVNRHNKFLGYYDSLEQAIKVYTNAKEASKALRMENKKKKLFHQRIA
jgi:hypothetical protein